MEILKNLQTLQNKKQRKSKLPKKKVFKVEWNLRKRNDLKILNMIHQNITFKNEL